MTVTLALILAAAAEPGHYDPSRLSGASAQFTRASEAMAPAYDRAEGDASRYALALRQWEQALDLLGTGAPVSERAAYEEARVAFLRQQGTLSRFVDETLTAFDQAFGEAVQRAIGGAAITACEAPATGLRLMPGSRRSDAPACPGVDQSDRLAAVVDADPKLIAAMERYATLPWPSFKLPSEPMVVAAGEVVDLDRLFRERMGARLADLSRADSEARLSIEAALEEGVSEAGLIDLQVRAARITAETAAKRAEAAARALEALDKLSAKRVAKGLTPLSLCPRPEDAAGCAPAATTAALQLALADRKVARALDKANAPSR